MNEVQKMPMDLFDIADRLHAEMRSAVLRGMVSESQYEERLNQVERFADSGKYYAAKFALHGLAGMSGSEEAKHIAQRLLFLSKQEVTEFVEYYVEYLEDAYRIEKILSNRAAEQRNLFLLKEDENEV